VLAYLPKRVQKRYRYIKHIPGAADALTAFNARLDRE
jgi:hypothetical protein